MANIPIRDTNSTKGLIGLGPIPNKAPVASFNVDQVENLIQTKGIDALHYKYAYTPTQASLIAGKNVNTETANRYGVLFYEIRRLKLVPYSMSLRDQYNVDGVYGEGSSTLNVAGNYSDGAKERVFAASKDLIVLNPTITVQNRQLVEYNPNGDMRLQYKVTGVDYLASASARYEQSVDFVITPESTVRWIKRPSLSAGAILSVVYWFSPIYIVTYVPHSLRILPDNPTGSGSLPRNARYAPQLVVCKMSHLMEESDLDFTGLPNRPTYPDTDNTTGGSW